MAKLAIDGLALRGQNGTLTATVAEDSYGPAGFSDFGPGGAPDLTTSTLNVDLLMDADGDGTADTALVGIDVQFTVNGQETTVPTDSQGRASMSFATAAVSDDVTVDVPPHILLASQNSAGLMTASANSAFDEITGRHVVTVASGIPENVSAHYFTVSASVSILSRSNEMVAPESLFFSATATGFPDAPAPTGSEVYDARMHELEYFWTFGDTRLFAPLEKTFGIMDQANHAYGAIVEHSYNSAGTKTPQVMISKWHNGYKLQAVAQTSLSIADQDSHFSGSNTFFIDPDGDYSTAPAGAVGYLSFEAAHQGLVSRTTPTRVMFRDGKTHVLTPAGQWYAHHPSIYMTSQKTGARPVLNFVPAEPHRHEPWMVLNYDPGQTKDMVWEDLDIAGGWDSATETGDNIRMFLAGGDKPAYALMHNCTLHGFNTIAQVGDTSRGHFTMSDCDVTDWASFGSLCSSKFFAFRGNRMARRIDALCGGPKFQNYNDHGPIRANAQVGLVMQNDLFSRSGWFPNNFNISGNALYSQQPCLRLATEVVAGAYYNVQQNAMEGGFEVMHLYPASTDLLVEPMNYVVERNLFVGSWMTVLGMRTFYGGGSIRNNVLVIPDVGRSATDKTYALVSTGYASQNNAHVAENLSAPVRISHNSVINRLSNALGKNGDAAFPAMLEMPSSHAFTGFATDHNLLHEPALSSPNIPDGPLDLSAIYTARMSVPYEAFDYGPVPGTTTPPDTPTLGRPLPGSLAVAAISDMPETCSDITGVARGLPDTRGACLP